MTSVHTCGVNCQISIISALFTDAVTCFYCVFLSYIVQDEGSHFDCSCFSDGGYVSFPPSQVNLFGEDGSSDTDGELNGVCYLNKTAFSKISCLWMMGPAGCFSYLNSSAAGQVECYFILNCMKYRTCHKFISLLQCSFVYTYEMGIY